MSDNSQNKNFLSVIKDFPTAVWSSVFRHRLPYTDLGRSQTSFTNFFLHIHPVKVHKHTLKPWFTMGLGLISLFLFLILTVTGILLMFYYVPSTTQAYDRMLDLRGSVAFGVFFEKYAPLVGARNGCGGFSAYVPCLFTGSYKKPREFNWVVGILLFLLTLFLSFTGYLLPWDQLAFWAITVGTAIAGYAPVFGEQIRFLLLGDTTVGQEALLRFYVLHVAVLPVVTVLLIAIHFWRIRKDGGLSRPEDADIVETNGAVAEVKETAVSPAPAMATASVGVGNGINVIEKKRYGVQGLVRGPFTKVGNVPDNSVFSYPNLLLAELFVFILTVLGVLVMSFFFNAPLEEAVNVLHPPNPAKAPWYFLGLQEMVSYSAFWGGVGIPALEVLILLLVPYFDRAQKGVGKWFAKERLLANTLFMTFVIVNIVLIIIGTFFRGQNWEFVSPF